MLTGVLYPDSGSATLKGSDIYELGRKYLRKIGVMYGNRTKMLPNLKVIDSLDMVAGIYG